MKQSTLCYIWATIFALLACAFPLLIFVTAYLGFRGINAKEVGR